MAHKLTWRVVVVMAGVLVLAGFWLFFLRNAAALPAPATTTTEIKPKKTIVLAINDMRDPLSAELARSTKRLVNENENLQAMILDAEGLRSRQTEQLQQMDLSGLAGLILSPVDLTDLDKSISRFNQAGIPVVLVNQAAGLQPLPEKQVTGIFFDALEAGVLQAAYCARLLAGEGAIVILAGPEDHETTRQMIAGVNEVLLNYPGLTIAEIEYGNWQRQSGKINMIRILQKNQNIAAVLAQNDEMLLGALPLIAGQSARLVKIGVGATTEGLEAISQGYIDATISINSQQMARLAFNTIIAAITGDTVASQVLTPRLISGDNLDAYVREIWNVN